ncbi:hypothetical protein EMIHUDRAFT_214166 [Emiliania huxleyi CCMP1516]|uniref:Methyltransferase FkbM domain-containing protein n=2 Tax=Emiliania huxleyi TaxID=2903 RepID=A0A0D3IKQ5_EMIH1|nr:hypothetical protein EMIHUDRAFT_214166 [Emiliania huxleyi CCMP1516]EOD11840.1 hypothetical protein EMIHUDRAFT_214166 [Emiliania huxleyi CCMP1516]|eukprot:XP_005764269.1 hypothetical protein EMIHUDRAFT_214166 [Emiliania huxleyi CCMP1516]
MSSTAEPLVCLGAYRCLPLSKARRITKQGWLDALPNVSLRDNFDANCLLCDEPEVRNAMRCSPAHPKELWNVSGAVSDVSELLNGLDWTDQPQSRMGWVPSLLPGSQTLRVSDGWRSYAPKSHMAVVLPCSSARGEDAAVMRTFFTHVETAAPLPGGVFLEIGGYNGVTESQSWVLEGCLGWQGVLVEANPTSFRALRAARPASLNIHMAACATAGSLNFSQKSTTMAKIRSSHDRKSGDGPSEQMVPVPCAPLGPVLTELGVDAIDFLSVDVEGVETLVLRSLVTSAQSLTLGVVLVEVRGDGQRRGIMELLLGVGMRYVGCIFGRPSPTNEVISDCFVNVSHLASRFPASRALKMRRKHGLAYRVGRPHTSSPSPAKSKWAARTIIDGYDLADTSCPSRCGAF